MTEIGSYEMEKAQFELEESQRLRGWISNSYAQIEYLLGDLILRCREFSCYDNHTQTLPHDATKRVKRVRALLKIDGPLAAFSSEIEQLLGKFESRHETRNQLAHGFATYHFTRGGDSGLSFQKWHRVPGHVDARLVKTFRLADLVREQKESVQLAQQGLQLFLSVHSHFGWVGND